MWHLPGLGPYWERPHRQQEQALTLSMLCQYRSHNAQRSPRLTASVRVILDGSSTLLDNMLTVRHLQFSRVTLQVWHTSRRSR
jgi:hypothetical protein